MPSKGTEISLGKDGFSFKTDGEASERLANAALDFLSPISEGAGFLGTKLRGYRMEAALKATVRAKQICEERGLPINPVPPKFLLQWVEGASMEDVDRADNLTEMWANLLVSKSTNELENSQIFIGLIQKLNWKHKVALEKFFEHDLLEQILSLKVIELLGCSIFEMKANKQGLNLDEEGLIKDVCEAFCHKKGVLVWNINLMANRKWSHSGIEIDETFPDKLKEMTATDQNMNIDLQISKNTLLDLESLNLIEGGAVTGWKLNDTHKLNVFFWLITPFGRQFLSACIAKKANEHKV